MVIGYDNGKAEVHRVTLVSVNCLAKTQGMKPLLQFYERLILENVITLQHEKKTSWN